MNSLKRILLIDDDETNNFLNQRLIKRMGFQAQVKVLGNGQQAFNYLYTICKKNYDPGNPEYFKPQLILLDVNMPVLDGFEFLQLYHNLETEFRRDIVLVLLTTSAHPEDARKAAEYRIDLLPKPLTAEMMNRIRQKYFPNLTPEVPLPADLSNPERSA